MNLTQSKKAAVIIVNWNGEKFLPECFKALGQQTYKNFNIFFVDNGSTDNSVKYVKDNFPNTKIVKLHHNTGFAKGNNIGISEALKDENVAYIITLNNDTKTDPKFIAHLVETSETNEYIGMVAPKIRYYYEKNLIDSVGILIHPDGGGINRAAKEIDHGQHDTCEDTFGACAGAALYKRSLLEDIKYGDNEYFDNQFFAYYEDLDLAWRAKLYGWKAITCGNAVVYHVHSATSISHSPFKAFHVNRNRFFVIIKNYPFRYLLKAFLLTPMRYIRLLNSIRIKKGPSHKLKEKNGFITPFLIVIKGWSSVIYHLPNMMKKRFVIQRHKRATNKQIHQWFKMYSAHMEDMIYK